VGAGDEVTDARVLLRLLKLEAVDVLRADATALGGMGALRTVREHAAVQGVALSLHAYGEFHIHCAVAWPETIGVECFEPDSGVYPAALFVQTPLQIVGGAVAAPTSPGLGLSLDWERINHHRIGAEE
jgi:L-alanine-DL-glutamate epimerase-like enolase superfamily enzyme